MRITSHRLWQCFYGIDTARRAAHRRDKFDEEIREHIGADSLAYLSVEDMVASPAPTRILPRVFTGATRSTPRLRQRAAQLEAGGVTLPARSCACQRARLGMQSTVFATVDRDRRALLGYRNAPSNAVHNRAVV